ncbi:UpxY family transcription antiterminator [bacterium]|nr:UpxY family transcription antiterminator [bacterium]
MDTNLIIELMEIPHWYALYTRSRHEKKVDAQLKEKGIESYLPLHTVIRQWSDRKKKVEEPLFRCYVFVHLALKDRLRALQTEGVVRMVSFGGKPSVIPDSQIEAVKRLLQEGLVVEPYQYLKEGQWVEVVQGPLTGLQGILIEKRGSQKLVVSIDSIRQSISVQIDARLVKAIY